MKKLMIVAAIVMLCAPAWGGNDFYIDDGRVIRLCWDEDGRYLYPCIDEKEECGCDDLRERVRELEEWRDDVRRALMGRTPWIGFETGTTLWNRMDEFLQQNNDGGSD